MLKRGRSRKRLRVSGVGLQVELQLITEGCLLNVRWGEQPRLSALKLMEKLTNL